ncbi:MAG: M1 family metallopeptidase [Alphaproteobacteria bacterium]|nr:M1 family metallopeptidase [Alphaproteobacteria bacterium]
MLTTLLASLALAGTTDGRLSNTVRPTSQTVRLTLDPRDTRYHGSVTIELEVLEKTTSFTLHAEDLSEIGAVRVGGKKPVAAEHAVDGPFLTVTLAKPLKPGRATLDIEFENDLQTNIAGLYKTAEKDAYIVTQFEADDARTAFPCFDEPSYKIPWTIELTTPTDLVTLSNMPEATATQRAGRTIHTFATSPPMSSYLVALVVGPFDAVPVEGTSVPSTVWVPKGTAPLAAEIAAQVPVHMGFLVDWFGSPLPYPKLDFAIVPEFAYGGMENVGLVVLTDGMLVSPTAMTPQDRGTVAEVVAHEIAHMWFGDLVTMAWWDDLWLNESFASWMGLKARAAAFPDNPGRYSYVRRAFRAMSADGRATMRPVRTVVDPANVYNTTNGLAYPKGQAVLGATEQWIGEEAFRKGIRSYMDAHRFGNATAADLFAALSDASGEDIGALLVPYLDRPGAPLLTFERTATGFHVRQQRYVKLGSAIEDDAVWPVPLVVRTPAGVQRFLIEGREADIALDAPWMLPMADGVGYHVWTFADPAELDALVAVAGELSEAEQIALVQDIAALTGGGALDLGRQLELFGTLAGTVSVPAQRSILGELGSVEDLVDTDLEAPFAAYLRAAWGDRLEEVGLHPTDADTPQRVALREGLVYWLGEHGEHAAVLGLWDEAARAFLSDPASVSASIAGPAMRSYARKQDAAFQDRMWALARDADDPRIQAIYVMAAASVEGEAERARALDWALAEERTVDETFETMGSVFEDADRHGDEALAWLTTSYDTLKAKLPPQALPHLVGVGAAGCDPERFARAKAFFLAPEHAVPGSERVAKEVEERVNACVERRATHGPTVKAFLEGYR